jgi:MOSC domain-containing protein YiiM
VANLSLAELTAQLDMIRSAPSHQGSVELIVRLAIGTAVIEVTEPPHNGCAKFSRRFGPDALRFVNSDEGKQLRLRGLNPRVVQPGSLRPGDTIAKL